MIIELCNCGGLPWHEHKIELINDNGTLRGIQSEEIRSISVDWKEYARSLLKEHTNG